MQTSAKPSWPSSLRGRGAQIDEEKIQAAIAGHLAKYKQLKRVFVTSNATRWARIQKKDLRETYKGTFASR